MAAIAKSGTVTLSTLVPTTTHNLSGLYAGEAIAAGDACYIKTSDGLVYRSTGAAANAAAVVDGFCVKDTPIGEPLTLMWGVNLNYGTGLQPGSFAYLSGTVLGGLDTAASTGGTVPVGRVIDATRIYVQKSY